jgi:hypothetical protein
VLAVGAGEAAVFAVEHDAVPRVPLLNDLQATVNLSSQVGIGEVLGCEDRAHGSAEFFERLVANRSSRADMPVAVGYVLVF